MADPRDPRNAAAERRLREALAQAMREARVAQGTLQEATARFKIVGQQIIGLVGASAQGVDKELVQSLQDAIHHTNTAVSALGAASSSTRVEGYD